MPVPGSLKCVPDTLDPEVASVSIIISTKNRRDDLSRALSSTLGVRSVVEIIVIDDGSTDGTEAMVRSTFPNVRFIRHEDSLGYIVRRNEGARIATGDIIVSIDDDAAFTDNHMVSESIRLFACERVGAVALPYVDVNRDEMTRQMAPDPPKTAVWLTSRFIGTAYAVRRDVFLALGGYREQLYHQGEESDFCVRLLDAGWSVALGVGAPINHFESPRRNFNRMDFYGTRNAMLFLYQNVPTPWFQVQFLITSFKLLTWTFEWDRVRVRLSGWLASFEVLPKLERKPVRAETYRLYRRLARKSAEKRI